MSLDVRSVRSFVFNKLTQVSSPSALPPIFTFLPKESSVLAVNYPNTLEDAKLNENWLYVTQKFDESVTQVNYIYNPSISVNSDDANINRMTSNDDRYLGQLYIPPNYSVHFYKSNPVDDGFVTSPDLTLLPNTSVQDASEIVLKTGELLVSKDLHVISAPFVIAFQLETLYKMIFNVCTKNRQYFVGPDKSINDVYIPGQTTCDKFMTSHCSSNVHESDEVCSCFKRQKLLDFQYGKDANVSVQCFDKSCLESSVSYKTNRMRLASNCSLSICQKVVESSKVLQNIKNDNIVCAKDDTATTLPPVPTKTTNPVHEQSSANDHYNEASAVIPPVSTTKIIDVEYPWYAWLFVGLTIATFIATFIVFFVRRKQSSSIY